MTRSSSTSSAFDRFAGAASAFASRPAFFLSCVLLVLVWIPSYFVLGNLNTWQLVINTATTIVTFLLVALLQNSQRRSDEAVHAKLDAIADGLDGRKAIAALTLSRWARAGRGSLRP